MKGVWFCIHWTCLCHWVFELPLSHLSPCSAIYLSFLTQGMAALSPLQICLCRFWMLSLHRAMSALTRVSAVVKCSHPFAIKIRAFIAVLMQTAHGNVAKMSYFYFFVFFRCPIYPRHKEPRSRSGTHSPAKMWGSCNAFSNIWVVQGWKKVSLDCLPLHSRTDLFSYQISSACLWTTGTCVINKGGKSLPCI